MGLIVAIITAIICTVVYVRMYKRELPEPAGVKKAAIPVALGVLAVILVAPVTILISLSTRRLLGTSIKEAISSPILSALVQAFLLAGFTEEFVKFLMFLITIKIVKPRNVYEYGMFCAGIGCGFTVLEDLFYGATNPVTAVTRLFFFAMHMMFGLLMGMHLGLAKYSKREGLSDAGKHIFLAFFLPVLWHTIFDSVTTVNPALNSNDDIIQMAGIIVALIVMAVSITLQFVLLIRFKKKTAEYCGMMVTDPEPEDVYRNGEENG